jgi:hypothetical protein
MPGSVMAMAVISSPSRCPAASAASARRGSDEEVGQADVVVQGEAQPAPATPGALELLADDEVEAEVVDPAAAVLLGHVDAEERNILVTLPGDPRAVRFEACRPAVRRRVRRAGTRP